MGEENKEFEPVIVGFFCSWCTATAADLAGTIRMQYPPNVRPIRTMCSSSVDPVYVLRAWLNADAVIVGGCSPGDCHYVSGNYKTRRRVLLLKKTLPQLGIEPERLRLEWISASEGAKFRSTVNEFIEQVTELGPLH